MTKTILTVFETRCIHHLDSTSVTSVDVKPVVSGFDKCKNTN